MLRYEHNGATPATTIVGAYTNSSTAFTLSDPTSWPTGAVGPFTVVIDRNTASEEKVLITSRSGGVLTVSSRGYDNTTAVAHANGATIEHCLTAKELDDTNAFIQPFLTTNHVFTESQTVQGDSKGLVIKNTAAQERATFGLRTDLTGNSNYTVLRITSDFRIYNPSDVNTFRFDPVLGNINATGSFHRFGSGAYDGTGTYTQIGDESGAARIAAKGATTTDVPLQLVSKGVGAVYVDTGGTFTIRNVAGSTTKLTLDASGILKAGGSGASFGTGAISGTGQYLESTDDANYVTLSSKGSATNVGIKLTTKGTASHVFLNGATTVGQFDPTSTGNFTNFTLRIASGGRTVEVGANDSGGAGYKMLRVTN